MSTRCTTQDHTTQARQPRPSQRTSDGADRVAQTQNPAVALQRAMAAPPSVLRLPVILTLQRTLGNRVVNQILAESRQREAPARLAVADPIQQDVNVRPSDTRAVTPKRQAWTGPTAENAFEITGRNASVASGSRRDKESKHHDPSRQPGFLAAC